jgi:hypothetical protein
MPVVAAAGLRLARLLRRDSKKIKCLSRYLHIPETRDFPVGSKRRFVSGIRPRPQGLARVVLRICRRASAARGDALHLI